MSKEKPSDAKDYIRLPAEELFAAELEALEKADEGERPEGWRLSPKAVLSYIVGGKAGATDITPKYLGSKRLVEIAIATLLTDRALLLIGEPGTAKSWLSEHLAAAISGDSKLTIQGTAGTSEEQVRYSWNYALLLAEGPSEKALVKSPIFRAMEGGAVARFEEVSRCASEVQDALISLLSEKRIAVPELGTEAKAKRGFSIIATANTRDRGVNDMSAALKRRFNTVVLPSPADIDTEVSIVRKRVGELSSGLGIKAAPLADEAARRIVTIFRELRQGQTLDGKEKVRGTSGFLSTAEAISMLTGGLALAASFGSGKPTDADLAAALRGSVVKDDDKDAKAWTEYLENIMKKRGGEWRGLYSACKELEE